MMSAKLSEARRYEEEYGAKISPQERPLFHVTPRVGWLNDPNGFSLYRGEYHLFYQYHPYDTVWGPMHWGHVKSDDLIKWEYLPASMAPDAEYDACGCFSGSAIELPDGRQMIMYTGVGGELHTEKQRQTQCLAFGDGIDYEKYEGSPVITGADLPEGGSLIDFRDPKIWRDEEEDCYYVVVSNRSADTSGEILLYRSKDALKWEFVTVLDRCNNEYGKMWECPDFFELDGKAVLLVSPMEMHAKGLEFHSGNDVICLLGDYDKKTHTFTREKVTAVDYGLDFYAPQTLLAKDGRRIMTAWMQSWESSHFQPEEAKWMGMLILPRELTYDRELGRLRQNPVRELLNYRADPVIYKDVRPEKEGRTELPGVSGRKLDMIVDVRPEEGAELYRKFTVNLAVNEEYITTLTYDTHKNTVCIDRTYSGIRFNIVSRRDVPVRDLGGRIRLRIIMDLFSIEVFINDGEQAMASCVYTPDAEGISFEADGAAVFDVEKYEIRMA